MRILSIHNRYLLRGGEEESYELETQILQERGHKVDLYEENNLQLRQLSLLQVSARTIWSTEACKTVSNKLAATNYDLIHVHNFFPLISPSVYYAAKKAKVPVVQTLQNFRLLCPNGLFLRQEKVCEDCLGKLIPYPGIIHSCYKNDRPASAGVAAMLTFHRLLGTWNRLVDRYIALTNYDRAKFIEGNLPAAKIVVKPNIVYPDPGVDSGTGNYALFVGRLSVEKGLDTLLEAWETLASEIPLKIVGDGPLAERVKSASDRLPQVEWLGFKPLAEVSTLMGQAKFLVYPSKWNETFSRVAVEAFAKGTPVIAAAGVTAMSELVDPGRTGLHFPIGDSAKLIQQVQWLLTHPEQLKLMRIEARQEFEAKYHPDENYRQLLQIYTDAIASKDDQS